jgi:multidrug transporter EmrE-like cation transporter
MIFAWKPIIYGIIMSIVDTIMMGLVKNVSLSGVSLLGMLIPMGIYSLEPWIFLSALSVESMSFMNIIWNLVSNILVTGLGVLYYGEKIGHIRMIGFVLAMISLVMLSFKD